MAGIVEVRTRSDLHRFINFPYKLYRGDPMWVPPLRRTVRRLLTVHPFQRIATSRYFLALQKGRVVGRIAAIHNPRYNEFHKSSVGFFGFFECVNDPAVAGDLFNAVREALEPYGPSEILGPASPSSNGEFGLLIEGFDRPPSFLMPYNKPYYRDLIEGEGFTKAKDLYAYELVRENLNHEAVALLERIASRVQNLRVRPLDMRRFEEDIQAALAVYHRAWERNWGFDPFSEEEFRFEAADLKQVVDPRICLFAEVGGQPVAFALSLPDINIALKKINGRLFPFGFIRFLLEMRKVDRIRTLLLGVVEGYRGRGLDALLYWETIRRGLEAGYRAAECSWILEDNHRMRKAIERLGGVITQTYRVYRRVC